MTVKTDDGTPGKEIGSGTRKKSKPKVSDPATIVGAVERRRKLELLALLDERQKREARRRLIPYIQRTFPAFQPARHHHEIAEHLEAVERGEIDRLMIVEPPRHGKSTIASARFPLWYLGRHPSREVIAASYGGQLSGDFGRQLRNLTSNPAHLDVFPRARLQQDSKAADRWHTLDGGVYIAAGVGGAITGRGANLLLIDDPVKSHEEADSEVIREKVWSWYVNDAYTRLMTPNAIVCIQTRWHDSDLAGKLIDEMENGGDKWVILHHPAIDKDGKALWPERYPVEWLERTKRAVGPRSWQSLYQGDPSPDEGLYFKAEWLWEYAESERPDLRTMRIYGASDYAVTKNDGDYTVHLVVGVDPEDHVYVLDLWREQAETDKWVDAFCTKVLRWKPIIWGEESGQIEKGVGPFLRKQIRQRKAWVARRQYSSAHDKSVRARPIQALMSCGMVRFPKNAPWWSHMRSELLRFPTGKHDDIVDTLSLIGRMLDELATGNRIEAPLRDRSLVIDAGPNARELPPNMKMATYDDIVIPIRQRRRRVGR